MTVEVRQRFALPDGAASFRFSGATDRGQVRAVNEDSHLASAPYFVVADGMGGHAHGDRASRAAISAFETADAAPADPREVLATITRANAAVRALAVDDASPISGTTLTGVALVDVGGSHNLHWMAFNIGDSRTYTWDGRALIQLSVDHSAVQELVDAGRLTAEQARRHPHRNVVTRALGADDEVDADIWLLPARPTQTFLLCSDGLTRELPDDEIARIIVFHDTQARRDADELPTTLAQRLVGAAVAAGGSDNITVVVVECELTGPQGSPEDTLERGSLPGVLEDTRPRG